VTEITAEDLTIKDLFLKAELDKVDYDPELATMFCQNIMEGNSMIEAACGVYASDDTPGMWESDDPDEQKQLDRELRKHGAALLRKFKRWMVLNDRFDQMVKLALQQRCYAYVEEMVEIADDATDDAVMGATGPTINGRAIRRAELMINTRKFVASKLLPKVFGDKTQMELTGADGKDLGPVAFNIQLIPSGAFVTAEQALKEAEERDGGAPAT